MLTWNWFSPESYIDAFQKTKQDVFERIVLDPVLRQAGQQFLDKQSEFAKMLVRNTIMVSKHSHECITKVWFPEMSKSGKKDLAGAEAKSE